MKWLKQLLSNTVAYMQVINNFRAITFQKGRKYRVTITKNQIELLETLAIQGIHSKRLLLLYLRNRII